MRKKDNRLAKRLNLNIEDGNQNDLNGWKKSETTGRKAKVKKENSSLSTRLFRSENYESHSQNPQKSDIEFQNSEMKDEEQLEIEELKKQHEEKNRENRWKLTTRIINILLVASCIYVVFLIYGVFVTDYQYNEDGTIEAQRLSVSEIKEMKNYETVLVQYENCRVLYEKVLMLDYRLGQGEEEPLTIAPEYEELLDTVNSLAVRIEAMSVDSKYAQIKSMLLNWVQNDIALYLQNMSEAISENDSEKANNALQDKDTVYTDFLQITSNIVATGEDISGIDLTDIKEWTPESYIDKEIKGD